MTSRKHVRRRRRRGLRRALILLILVGLPVGLLGGGALAGYRYEQARTERILPGITIAGVDVGGMSRDQAVRALDPMVRSIVDRPIVVHGPGVEWHTTPGAMGTRVDVTGAVDQALAVSQSYGWPSRAYHRFFHKPIHRSFDITVMHGKKALARFVRQAAGEVAVDPVDAGRDFVGGHLVVQHSKPGRVLNSPKAYAALRTAVEEDTAPSQVRFTTREVAPSVGEDAFGMLIVVRVSENRLYLYDGFSLEKTYSVATGQLDKYPTPLGHFEIANKRINPTWINPAKDTWGKDEPDQIPPGPDNPLGTRALDLSAPGIRIHGTPSDSSIGHWASHGCIRMHIPDSEDLYPRVEVGTPVIIAW